MWKCASRTLRATLRKRVLRSTTVLSTKVTQSKDNYCLLKFAPALLEHCSRFYSFCRGNCENFSKEKKDREGPKEKKTSFLRGFDNNFFDALKWSGAFVLGYYLLQPFGCKKKFSTSDLYEELKFCKKATCQETLLYLIDAVRLKPYNCVVPEVQAAKSKKANENQFSEPPSSSAQSQSDNQEFIGLEKAQQKVLGTLSNWFGTKCMQSGRYKEGLEYFMQSADEENAAGIFNLGICHEKGLGTSQNLKRAGELYQRAADLGHATAMYNLGIFYARGIGGIELNIDHARDLFRAAANLGQRDAAKALCLEKQEGVSEEVLLSKSKQKVESTLSECIFETLLSQSASNSHRSFEISDDDDIKNSFFEYPDGKEIQSSLGSDSGVLDLSHHNEPNVLLV